HVHAEEATERSQHERRDADAPPLRHRLVGGQRGVAVGAREEVADVAIRAVLEVAAEPLDATVDAHGFVDRARAEPSAAAAEESHLPVGGAPAVADPASPEDVPPPDGVAVARATGCGRARD